ncbi:MAG: DUF4838 domain-containing protein, partial [Ruminococcaceae bacterium]|nr:DUF4838 domain-containing protein [Oscillospiraceae bacterium]
LRQMGCRWLFPGVDGEYIPIKATTPVKYRFKPSMRYRGQCNEGAEFHQCMLDAIDFAPKIGMNVFMMEFFIPSGYYNFYYEHINNENNRKPEPVSYDQVLQWKRQCEAEIEKRGLQFHDIGHGWTCEPLGIDSRPSFLDDSEIPDDARRYIAMRNGKRTLWMDKPRFTEFCMSNTAARKKVVDYIVDYIAKHDNADYIHVWLADSRNNHCECEDCVKKTASDWYITLLNELDAALTKASLDTRIVFIAYTDTTFAPLEEAIKNQNRFTLMLAPVTRSFTKPLPTAIEKVEVPKYERNNITLPTKVEEYFLHLDEWRKSWHGSCIAYEYHFWRHQYYDLPGINIAKVIHEDVKSYEIHGIRGIIQDGSQRSFFPNGFAFYAYARTLYDTSISFEELKEDYFSTAYGDCWEDIYAYLEKLSDAVDFGFVEQEKSLNYTISRFYNPPLAKKIRTVPSITAEGLKIIRDNFNSPYRIRTFSMKVLELHAEYANLLAEALAFKALGLDKSAWEKYYILRDTIGKYEAEFQGVYDHGLAMNSLKNNVFSLLTSLPESPFA